ncbi:MAG TPA: KUP/HAK/KT family potassium transporter [Rubellimicrobium sp.]|nr:KUP/HAK/KT family potassium transporter [Rubellimicrobium sp.]
MVQRWGTGAVSVFFGPVMLTWFSATVLIVVVHLSDYWSILRALGSTYAAGFLLISGLASLIVLGSVFLAVTGGEALYADSAAHSAQCPTRSS